MAVGSLAAHISGSLRVADSRSVCSHTPSRLRGQTEVSKGWETEGRNGGLSRSWVNFLLLVDQPLQALEVHLLVRIVSQRLEDHAKAAGSSCHAAQLLLTLGCPSYAQVSTQPARPGPAGGTQPSDASFL